METFDTLASRISYVVKTTCKTKTEFARRLKVSQAFISQMCSGAAKPSERTITDICQIFGVDEIWLRTGDGQPFREQTKEEVLAEVFSKAKVSPDIRNRFVQAFAKLPDEDFAAMEKILLHIIEQVAQSHETSQSPPSAKKEETP